jgi:DNA-binding transcriptional ArsR family regulator
MKKTLLRPEILDGVVERFAAAADPSRIRLLLRLREDEANVATLSKELGIRQASVSKHLSVLRRVGLVEARQVGNKAIYMIRDDSVFEMCKIVCNGVLRQRGRSRRS